MTIDEPRWTPTNQRAIADRWAALKVAAIGVKPIVIGFTGFTGGATAVKVSTADADVIERYWPAPSLVACTRHVPALVALKTAPEMAQPDAVPPETTA